MSVLDQIAWESPAAHRFRQWLAEYDRVLIGAGAGLSASAGVDFADRAAFARLYPTLVRRGFQADYQLIGYEEWEPAEKWGYLATHVNEIRFRPHAHRLYPALLDLVREKDYFVMTSNVDALFARCGFDQERIFTPQGDYAAMQCLTPCQQRTWPSRPIIEEILTTIDAKTQRVTDAALLPKCPFCGAEVFLNVRGGDWFVDAPYDQQRARFRQWLYHATKNAMLIVEIGAGFNTPGVIRWPLEAIARANRKSRFVRINVAHIDMPTDISDRALSMRADAFDAVKAGHSSC